MEVGCEKEDVIVIDWLKCGRITSYIGRNYRYCGAVLYTDNDMEQKLEKSFRYYIQSFDYDKIQDGVIVLIRR